MNTRPTWPLLRLFNRRRAVAHPDHAPRQVDVARRHEYAERLKQQCLHGPPMPEWERDAAYGAVEQERARG